MTTAPLLPEDRTSFEAVLNQALRSAQMREALRGAAPDAVERLRMWGREAADELMSAAEPEYRDMCRLRDEARSAALARSQGGSGWLLPALAVLVPLVAAAASLIFLLLGYALMLTDSQHDVGTSLVLTGLVGRGDRRGDRCPWAGQADRHRECPSRGGTTGARSRCRLSCF